MEITLGYSPCPNDTYIFEALANQQIDTQGIQFNIVLEDVQTLNQWALEEKLDITKVSYGVLPLIKQNYQVLTAGSALGKGVGPLLIAKNKYDIHQIPHLTIAVPGENTTANLLLNLAFPNVQQKVYLTFNEIENAILMGKVDAGVIIHENRFTYQSKGLIQLFDLGVFWEDRQNMPLPLGGIVAHKRIPIEIQQTINTLITNSIVAANQRNNPLSNYIRVHAQEMSDEVMLQHIRLYVNNFSQSLGMEGKNAIQTLCDNRLSVSQFGNVAYTPIVFID